MAVRDATFLYEVEIRGGAPRKATRTASDGSFQSGERALAMLLAVGAGRFSIASSTEAIRGELTGTLFEQLARPLAAARGALAATTGVANDGGRAHPARCRACSRSTCGPRRIRRATVLKRLAAGASPRALLARGRGRAEPRRRLALRSGGALRHPCGRVRRRNRPPDAGGRRGARGADGRDSAAAIAAAERAAERRCPSHRDPRARTRRAARGSRTRSAAPLARAAEAPRGSRRLPPRPRPRRCNGPRLPQRPTPSSQPGPARRPPLGASALAPPSRVVDDDSDSDAPSSLEDAVMRGDQRTLAGPGGRARRRSTDRRSSTRASSGRARRIRPRTVERTTEAVDEQALLPSIPPDAVVPAASSNEEFAVAAPVAGEVVASPHADEAHQLTSETAPRRARAEPGPCRGETSRTASSGDRERLADQERPWTRRASRSRPRAAGEPPADPVAAAGGPQRGPRGAVAGAAEVSGPAADRRRSRRPRASSWRSRCSRAPSSQFCDDEPRLSSRCGRRRRRPAPAAAGRRAHPLALDGDRPSERDGPSARNGLRGDERGRRGPEREGGR